MLTPVGFNPTENVNLYSLHVLSSYNMDNAEKSNWTERIISTFQLW